MSLRERGKCSCLNEVAHSRKLKSFLKNKNQGLDLREGERERSSNFGSQELLCFSKWPIAQGGRSGAIYSPHLKRAIGESFHRTSPVGHQTSLVKLSRSRFGLNLSGPPN
jgi:hypothetical protein